MKLANNRFYFDFNSTAPLAKSVTDWLAQGAFYWANPASLHASGREAKKIIRQTTDYLLDQAALKKDFELFYHSGATEGINTVIKGFAREQKRHQQKIHFFYALTDHAVVKETAQTLKEEGHSVHNIPLLESGEVNEEELIQQVMNCSGPVLINWTVVHNETGVVWPLKLAEKIKKNSGATVHVDAAQLPGKIIDYQKLSPLLDAYTFSGHKFGSLKGVGFSLFNKKSLSFMPLLHGGEQQGGLRPGTENAMGIYSLQLAWKELREKVDVIQAIEAREWLEKKIRETKGSSIQIVGSQAKERNSNTLYLISQNKKADALLMLLDQKGLEVSLGSACKSGSVKPNQTLLALGYTENEARSAIRFSFSPQWGVEDARIYWDKIKAVL